MAMDVWPDKEQQDKDNEYVTIQVLLNFDTCDSDKSMVTWGSNFITEARKKIKTLNCSKELGGSPNSPLPYGRMCFLTPIDLYCGSESRKDSTWGATRLFACVIPYSYCLSQRSYRSA